MSKKILIFFILIFAMQVTFAEQEYPDINLVFFDKFNDDFLFSYVNTAAKNNHEYKKTKYVVEQYRQQIKYSFSKELPSFSVGANYLGIHTPRFGLPDTDNNAFVLPFLASYEADILLKNRDKTKSYKKTYEASKFEQKALYLSLLTDVATVYTNILQYDDLLANYQKIHLNNEKILLDARKLYNQGIINLNQLNEYKKQYEDSKIYINNTSKEKELLLMQLALLCAMSPANINEIKYGNFKNFEYGGKIPDEVSSDVIFSRPDVLAAEAKLQKAKIDIRVARKEFFPRFNIVGAWVFNTVFPGNFFSWESSLALILAGATQDIFQGGRKIANLKIQKAKYEELFENYKQADLNAIKEVNSALCFVKYDTQNEKNIKQKTQYQNTSLINKQKEYNQGIISNIEIIQSENENLTLDNELIRAKAQRLVNYFTLYKALGGKL